MAEINRVLNIGNNNPAIALALGAMADREPNNKLGAKSLIQNQALPIETTREETPASIIFTEYAYSMLNFLKNIHHKSTVLREKIQKKATPTEFVCYGYRDHNGDIVICDIDSFSIDEAKIDENSVDVKKIAEQNPNKDIRIDSTARMFEYIRHSGFTPDELGKEPVALLGILRPEDLTDEKKCTPTLKEVADIVPPANAIFPSNFSTGILLIPKDNLEKTKEGFTLVPASMECLLIENSLYGKGSSRPTNMTNITRAMAFTPEGTKSLSISQNPQDLSNLPIPKLNKPNFTDFTVDENDYPEHTV